MSRHSGHGPITPGLAQTEQLRLRLEDAERLASLRDASLNELSDYAGKLRCQIADLADDLHAEFPNKPYPPEGLRYVTDRVNRLADTLARAAAGYVGARSEDMDYPQILDDLAAHGWISLPDHKLTGAAAARTRSAAIRANSSW